MEAESTVRVVSVPLAVNNRGSNNGRIGVVKVNLASYGNGLSVKVQVNVARAGIDAWSNNDHIAIDNGGIANSTLDGGIIS